MSKEELDPFEFLFNEQYIDYLEALPSDDREETLQIHIKHFKMDVSSFELFAIISNRDIEKLRGKID